MANLTTKHMGISLKNPIILGASNLVGNVDNLKKAEDAGIKEVVFDRNGYRFHGRVKALAEAAREQGLKF